MVSMTRAWVVLVGVCFDFGGLGVDFDSLMGFWWVWVVGSGDSEVLICGGLDG